MEERAIAPISNEAGEEASGENSRKLLFLLIQDCSAAQAIRNNEVLEILKGFYIVYQVEDASAAQLLVSKYNVSTLPFFAIIDPVSQNACWSSSTWRNSESWVEELLAVCLRYVSYDVYEGLSNVQVSNWPEGCYPPIHLVSPSGSLEEVVREAKASSRWLLINIQNYGCMSCYNLNRDVWLNEAVESIVKENFVFWQKFDCSNEAVVYTEKVQVTNFPHVCILSPFDGRVIWKKEGWSAEKSLDIAKEFCEVFLKNSSIRSSIPPPFPMED